MFTLKFFKHFDETNTHREVCISTPVYEKYQFEDGNWAVTIHKSPILTTGVEYKIGDGKPDDFNICYVENQFGKTIDKIRKVEP